MDRSTYRLDFGEVIQREIATQGNAYLQPAVHQKDNEYKYLLWALARCVLANSKLTANLAQSDEAQLNVLLRQGLKRSEASSHHNNCLIDSLLQLLRTHSLLGVVTNPCQTCQDVRNHLCTTKNTYPRTPQGFKDPEAFLEHNRHAAVIVAQLLGDRRVETLSLDLVVHARHDTPQSPPDILRVFGGDGTRSPGSIVLNIFKWTGYGTIGYHYDPLFTG